jgi:hypothetical protein
MPLYLPSYGERPPNVRIAVLRRCASLALALVIVQGCAGPNDGFAKSYDLV